MTLVLSNFKNHSPRFFDSFLLKDLLEKPEAKQLRNGTSFPAVNIKENEKKIEIEVAAPGLKKENFSVQLEKNILTISAASDQQLKENKEGERFTLKEFTFSSFKRSFSLKDNVVEPEKIEGNYENGILRIILPKKEEKGEKVKKIKIL